MEGCPNDASVGHRRRGRGGGGSNGMKEMIFSQHLKYGELLNLIMIYGSCPKLVGRGDSIWTQN
jgi:hypothetical protein